MSHAALMNYQVLAHMAWTVITILSLLAFLALLWRLQKSNPNSKKQLLPPGPAGLPVIGSMHLLGKLPHRDLHRLAQKYGPIMHLRLGLVPTIVVSSASAAQLFLKDHDLVFASRPPFEAAKIISYGQKNLSFAYYGSYWRGIRKMCTLELLSNHKINSFRWMRKEELNLLIESIKEASQSGGTAVNLSENVATMSANMTCRMVFGKKYHGEDIDDRGFKGLIQEGMHLSAQPNIGNYIPQISWLDLQGLNRKMKVVGKKFDSFFEMIIDEHVQKRNSSLTGDIAQDFVDVMLDIMGSKETEYKLERDNIKAIVLDMFAGGTDTSATVIEWALSELMRHPMVLKKVQKELEDMVGLERMVEESDLEKLKYLETVVKETLRLHPVAPLLLPHASTEDCTVDGFHIPKKSHLVVNAWAIGRDPDVWQEAEKFWPERFEGSKVDVRGRDFELIPFGSGRRSCPGMQLGLTVVRLVLAQLMHCFDWELPDGMLPNELDMSEEFGLVTPRAKHLFAKPSYRLNL